MQPQPPQPPQPPPQRDDVPDLPTAPLLPPLSAAPTIPLRPFPLVLQPSILQDPPQEPLPSRKPPRRRSGTSRKIVSVGALVVVSALCAGLVLGGSGVINPFVATGAVTGMATATTGAASDVSAATTPSESTATVGAQSTTTTHPQPTSTPRPRPTNTLTPTTTPCAAPCNPWGYNFDPAGGATITSPPAAFCSYFTCIGSPPAYTTFWSGKGYVVECQDGSFAMTGGVHNTCSQDGDYWRTLYSH
jgi:hypothetical protein